MFHVTWLRVTWWFRCCTLHVLVRGTRYVVTVDCNGQSCRTETKTSSPKKGVSIRGWIVETTGVAVLLVLLSFALVVYMDVACPCYGSGVVPVRCNGWGQRLKYPNRYVSWKDMLVVERSLLQLPKR